jgi:chromosome segregation ATPase
MTNPKEIIQQLKEVREEKGLSYGDIIKMMEDNGDIPVSQTTLSRIFADGSEEKYFSYETTILPLARAILDLETIEDDDDASVKAMKELLKVKKEKIRDLELQIEQMEAAHNKEMLEKMEAFDKEREAWSRSIEFLKEQISLKDARMDMQNDRTNSLLDRIEKKDDRIDQLTSELLELKNIRDAVLTCPYRSNHED